MLELLRATTADSAKSAPRPRGVHVRPRVVRPRQAGKQRRLRELRLDEATSRPLTTLHALVEQWWEAVSRPQWTVELAWLPGLQAEKGVGSALVFFPRDRIARIVLDAGLDDPEAERQTLGTLAQLIDAEVRAQIRQARRRRRFPE